MLKRIFDAFNTNTWWIAYQFHFLSTPLFFSAINLAVKAQQRIAKALKLELMRDTMLPSMKNLLKNRLKIISPNSPYNLLQFLNGKIEKRKYILFIHNLLSITIRIPKSTHYKSWHDIARLCNEFRVSHKRRGDSTRFEWETGDPTRSDRVVILCDPSQKTPHPSTLRIAHDSRSTLARTLLLLFFFLSTSSRESPFYLFAHTRPPSGNRIFGFYDRTI